ncbi:MAG: hypothetical protein M0Z75_16835 [Nitrospiraceae bacterium]|nr:hypothetical protein [Nitrospiraceae bacterium]
MSLKTRLYLIAACILVAGLGSASAIYLTAADYSDNVGYEIINGQAYPVAPGDSKMYMHDMELYGGKANVIADEFIRWFDGLWHGKTPAFIVAFIAASISLMLIFYAAGLPSKVTRKN